MKKRKLIILSLDAMITEDVEYLKDKPLVKKMLEKGSWIKTLRTVFPANTYPCHSSMITGCYPDKTGVDTNYYKGTTTWRAERENIQVETLIDVAKKAGYTTANVFWPVLGGDKNVDYNVPEYFYPYDQIIDVFKKQGATDTVISEIVEPNTCYLKDAYNEKEPQTSEFIFSCAIDILKKFKPDILLLHPCPLDTARHKTGAFSAHVTKELERSYVWVEKLYETVKEIGEEDNTDFVWMSDHGQFTINTWCRFLTVLKAKNLIKTDENGNSIGGAVTFTNFENSILLKVNDKDAFKETTDLLYDLENKGYVKVYTKKQAVELFHFDRDFDYLVDSNGVYGIGREAYGELFTTIAEGVKKDIGIHGHSPDILYQPTLLCIGPDFKNGVTLDRVETVNVPVTLAKCLGLKLEEADGTVIDEILK